MTRCQAMGHPAGDCDEMVQCDRVAGGTVDGVAMCSEDIAAMAASGEELTIVRWAAPCDKCKAPATHAGRCLMCQRDYLRCRKCGGDKGVGRSLSAHAGLTHPGKQASVVRAVSQ